MTQRLLKFPYFLVTAFLALSGLTFQTLAQVPTPAKATAQVLTPVQAQAKAMPDYPLGAGDAIRVQVFQNPDLTIETRVSENGSITYPMIGAVELGGLSIALAEKKIADALQQGGFIQKPQVNIVLTQIRGNQIAVLGQVNRPGRFPLETANTRLSDMLANAGGATIAGDDIVIVTGLRNGKSFRKQVDIPSLFLAEKQQDNIVLQGGDSIFVDRAPVFFIYGEAQHPGSFRIERNMTVMQALAAGGGPTPRGSERRLRLHRKAADGSIQQLEPKLTDTVLPNDVIYVKESIF
ncbi:MAG: polysaccharide export protein EpsE [Rhodoferax sp.]|uniref:polysaccharide export protein EpsE n=1 Tax=Rhodoferax sp. TaxID=50421 RepID=UPI0017DE2899|nr:polysaccharide export protein EpsE [Rhodoferax sp.]NMM21286.1 polysaccharide export protein EpsE [Rhodoferax sp.]